MITYFPVNISRPRDKWTMTTYTVMRAADELREERETCLIADCVR